MFEVRQAPEEPATQRLTLFAYLSFFAAAVASDAMHLWRYGLSNFETLAAPTAVLALSLFWLVVALRSGPPTKHMLSKQVAILVLIGGVNSLVNLLRM